MEGTQNQITLEAIFTPTPDTKRAQRSKFTFKNSADGSENILCFGAGPNLVMKDLNDFKKSVVYNHLVQKNVTCARFSNKGYYIAFGDEQGGIKVIGYSEAEKDWMIKMEDENILGGKINEIMWSDDDKKLAIVGCGPKRAIAINLDSKNTVGDVSCTTGDILTCDLKISRPFKFICGGEEREINYYKAMPMNHLKTMQNVHTNFIQKVAFTPNEWDKCAHFITVSSDKSIKVHNCETYELVVSKDAAHSMGIIDFCFNSNPWEIVTCSSDRTLKTWKLDLEAKSIELIGEMTLSDFDLNGYKENIEKQQLAVIFEKNSKKFYALSNNSDINVWGEADGEKPIDTIRGH